MKVRKVKYLAKVLRQKGFQLNLQKDHHNFYYLTIDDIKFPIYTYLSHSIDEYGNDLMKSIKIQLKFRSTRFAEDFFDCPLSKEDYINMLREDGFI